MDLETAIKDGINAAILTIVTNRAEDGDMPLNLTDNEIRLIEGVVIHYVSLEVNDA